MNWLHTNNYVIVNNSDTCFINIYGVLPCTPTLFTVYSAYMSGATDTAQVPLGVSLSEKEHMKCT